ncbi:MAG: AbrB/MazE/SpoVT family DNA-binding domain-containing protein [Armatimonadota bacterium]|nr:AbrB/MazE/SpoVT family DNA-binding domain-containing protein [Armatimonadota bacterium]
MPNSRMIRVSSKGQIVLPKSLREKAGISDGDFIYIEEVDGILLIEKPAPSKLAALTQRLRKEASERRFTRRDLEAAISETKTQSSR